MNPLRITASNYRTFDTLELDLPEGCLAVIGENGAGKSSIVNVIDLALFGPETRSLGDYLTDDGSTEMELELTFEHAGELYRVRRCFSGRGRGISKLDLEKHILHPESVGAGGDAGWIPLTAESQKETQAALERLLGLSRETFRASAFLAQGDGAVFTEAKPADRKRILADVLGLQVWESALKLCRADKSSTTREIDTLTGRIATLAETAGDTAEISVQLDTLKQIAADADRERDKAEENLEHASESVRQLQESVSQVTATLAALSAAKARLDAHARVSADAVEASTLQSTLLDELATLATAGQTGALEQQERDLAAALEMYRSQVAARDEISRRRELLERQQAAIAADAAQRRGRIADVEARIAHLEQNGPGDDRCDLCLQLLGAEALQATLSNLRAQAVTLNDEARALEEQAASVTLPDVPAEPEPPTVDGVPAAEALADVRDALGRARGDEASRARLEERVRACQEKIDAAARPEYLATLEQLQEEHRQALADRDAIDEPEPGALDTANAAALTARARIEEERLRYDSARAAIARLEERLDHAERVAGELDASRTLLAGHQAVIDDLVELERAYGRDGIPALIVEQAAIPQIETEACRILAELGTSYRVELRTEAALKSGDGVKDTLDIVIHGEAGERDYSTFSGGERSRINVALRIALARLLAHRRGAESRVLVLDEIEYLDEAGHMRLADVARGLKDDFDKVIVVSHAHALRDSFDQAITVTKTGNRSEAVIA